MLRPLAPLFVFLFVLAIPARAQEDDPSAEGGAAGQEEMTREQFLETFEWKRDGTGQLGSQAEISIPEGFQFISGEQAKLLLQGMGNLIEVPPDGLIGTEDLDGFVVFYFEDSGYVKDDEKDELDAVKLFAQKLELQEASNAQRRKMGLDTLTMTGWAREPFYNAETNNLEWGVILESSSGGQSVNYETKLLGREGVMDATLVCDPVALDSILPAYQELLTGFSYTDGHRYAQYEDGDKLAQYGLTALVVGGAAALGAKAGLFAVVGKFLAKAWKLVVVGVIGLGVAIKKLFGFGKHTYARD